MSGEKQRGGSGDVRGDGEASTAKRGLLAQIVQDAIELTRAVEAGTARKYAAEAPSAKRVVREALASDSFKILALSRLREAARKHHVPAVNYLLRVATMVVFGIEIDKEVTLGDGVYFTHSLGVVVGGTAKVGARVRFMGNNTVGTAKDNGYPVIEDDVLVGAGARILGPIHIGAGATIGANSVVLEDVPAGAVVVGSPARIVSKRKTKNEELS